MTGVELNLLLTWESILCFFFTFFQGVFKIGSDWQYLMEQGLFIHSILATVIWWKP